MSPTPHLHPRSTATSTLFAGTLLASFIVIGIPHVFPCPRPKRGFSDSEVTITKDGKVVRRMKRKASLEEQNEDVKRQIQNPPVSDRDEGAANVLSKTSRSKTLEEEAHIFKQLQAEAVQLESERRECPVPKPTGRIGRWLGFQQSNDTVSQTDKVTSSDAASTIISQSSDKDR